MALLPSGAWKWIALIAFLIVPGLVVARLLHSAVWIAVAPGIFVILMLVFAVLLSGGSTPGESGTKSKEEDKGRYRFRA